MTPERGNGRHVPFTRVVAAQVKHLHQEAEASGKGEAFAVALRQMLERLQADARSFGDPQYRLPKLRLMIYQAAVSPLVVSYAVHDDRPLVFIRSFRMMS